MSVVVQTLEPCSLVEPASDSLVCFVVLKFEVELFNEGSGVLGHIKVLEVGSELKI